MDSFRRLTATAVPLMRTNVDTDVIIPIGRLIDNPRGKLAPYAFEAWRNRPDGTPDPDFALNRPRYQDARVLVAGDNFGCGSSREAAVWALIDCGIRCVIAPSFGDIFNNNCFQNGVLPVRLPAAEVAALAAEIESAKRPEVIVDLEARTVTRPSGKVVPFEIDEDRRQALLEGLDEIGMTLKLDADIRAFQARDRLARPWIYRREETERMHRILILPGDGIGPEVMAEVRRIVEWFVAARGLRIDLREELFGVPAWEAHRNLMREETWNEIAAADAILFGAIGSPDYERIPAEARKIDWLLHMRRTLDLFINFRPVKPRPALFAASSLRPEVLEGCDMVIVRELAGGIYFGEPRGVEPIADGERAFNTCVYTTAEVRRIARAAFELARVRQGRVCSVDKANVLVETGGLWRRTVQALRDAEFPDVALSHMYVDNCAMQLVRAPAQFDVLLTENLFGDILSDCAAMITGSLGMLPSVSMSAVGADGRRKALYEPIHGSAPDIAGKGIANPVGAILSFALCLRYSLGLAQEATRLEEAVDRAIAAGARTADIADKGTASLSTRAMGDAILAALEALP